MNLPIAELDVVRVVALLKPDRAFDGSDRFRRPPRVGDQATVVHVLEADRAFIAEAVDPSGYTLWVANFVAEELVLERSHRARS